MAKEKRPVRKSPAAAGRTDPHAASPAPAARLSPSSLLDLQRTAGNAATGRFVGELMLQAKQRNASGFEIQQDTVAASKRIAETAPASDNTPAGPEAETPSAGAGPAPTLVVDDSVDVVGPGQMRKREFFARLRDAVGAAAEGALAGTGHAGHAGQPIAMWLGAYENQDVERINRDLPRFAGDRPQPATADGYIPLIADRVRVGVTTWAQSGELTGIPPGLSIPGMDMPGGGLPGALAGLGGPGGVFFKARTGGPRDPGDPRAIQSELGEGRPLDGGVRSRMERALGHSFAHVRVHTDGAAPGIASRLNAKAFTVGEHVAFGAREYRPGTLVGDALLAHELAHVVQQGESRAPDPSSESGGGRSLEADADRSAVGAVSALWGKDRSAIPRLLVHVPARSSRLRLQRCAGCGGTAAAPTQRRLVSASTDCSPPDPATWTREVEAAEQLQGGARVDTMATLLQRALCDTGRRVAIAGSSHADRVHPEDYEKTPVINFDIDLNKKKAWVGDRTLSSNYGYSFNSGADEYVVLGPVAVDDRSPTFSRMYMEHEVFHTEHHIGAGAAQLSAADKELETWTVDFRRYFHQLHSFRMQWSPLVGYYEQASEGARSRSLDQLADYYNNPPVPEAERERIRAAFASWLRRRLRSEHRDARLIQDLESRLHLGAGGGP